MADQGFSMPGTYGGLMRYNEEYESPFKISPEMVIVFIVVIIGFVAALKIFWPIAVA